MLITNKGGKNGRTLFKSGMPLLDTLSWQTTVTDRHLSRTLLEPISPKQSLHRLEQQQERRHSLPPPIPHHVSRTPHVRNFSIIRNLSRSSHTNVDLVQCRFTNKLLVLKSYNMLSKNSLYSKSLLLDKMNQNEVSIMKKVNHPNVVRLLDTFEDHENNRRYLVIEYVKNGALVSDSSLTCQPFVLATAWRYFCHLVNALDYLHEMNIVHRDIKPSNLLLTADDHIKLSDFGVSIDVTSKYQSAAALTGSSGFLAPELVSGYVARASKSSDIWAAGITLFFLVFGRLPFYDQQVFRLYRKICHDEISFPLYMDPLLKHVLLSMLDKNPKTRITAEQLKVHPFVLHGPYKSSITIRDTHVVDQRLSLLSTHHSVHNCSSTCIHRLLPTVFRSLESDQTVLDSDDSIDRGYSFKRSSSANLLRLGSTFSASWIDDDGMVFITDDENDFEHHFRGFDI
ncbi:hypothetical protein GEMRC1_001026 [Eukaryota sp. GEM-RC1]